MIDMSGMLLVGALPILRRATNANLSRAWEEQSCRGDRRSSSTVTRTACTRLSSLTAGRMRCACGLHIDEITEDQGQASPGLDQPSRFSIGSLLLIAPVTRVCTTGDGDQLAVSAFSRVWRGFRQIRGSSA